MSATSSPQARPSLAVGSRKTIGDMLAFVLLRKLHGDSLKTFFLDEEGQDESLLNAGDYERIYALNASPNGNAEFFDQLKRARVMINIGTLVTKAEGSLDVAQIAEKTECVYQIGLSTHLAITYQRCTISGYPAASALMNVLFYLGNRIWVPDNASVAMLPQLKFIDDLGEVFSHNFRSCLMTLESLPDYASNKARDLHSALVGMPNDSFDKIEAFLNAPFPS